MLKVSRRLLPRRVPAGPDRKNIVAVTVGRAFTRSKVQTVVMPHKFSTGTAFTGSTDLFARASEISDDSMRQPRRAARSEKTSMRRRVRRKPSPSLALVGHTRGDVGDAAAVMPKNVRVKVMRVE